MPTRSGAFRGGVDVGGTLYGAWTGEVYTVNIDGEVTYFSTLDGSDLIFIGKNTKSPNPDIAVVTDAGASIINTTAGAVQSYPDGDVGSPSCVTGYLGYLWFGYSDGTMFASDFNSTNINTLNQAKTITNDDGITHIFGFRGQIYACGKNSIEVWGEPINPTGFPLTRVGFHITPGLFGKYAIAGYDEEWGQPPIYVGSDGTIRILQGYQAVKISNTDVEDDLREIVWVDRDSVNCCVYNTGGNAFWQVNLPTKSWVFHVNEGTWHERRSQGQTKSLLRQSVYFADRWLVGKTDTTALLRMTLNSETEDDNEITCVVESGPMKQFPYGQRIVRADFDVTVGVGEAVSSQDNAVDPQMLIEVSHDGGHTWPHSWNRKVGKEGDYLQKVFVNSPGITRDEGARWRVSFSDPVHFGLQGGDMAVSVLSK